MSIDAKETLALAEMLRIELSAADAFRLAEEMSSVLDYVKVLERLDVSGVDPMGTGRVGFASLREDRVGECLSPGELESLSGGAFDPQSGAFATKAVFT
ncbi:MAG: aspartyl/glutamyl-tRNA amidotransferase subunit C [Planctomycetes bacterium]|nr:aspartyl/glutamyl-tRNA amidotransferase subunit C [Planctomycetota bacterium]